MSLITPGPRRDALFLVSGAIALMLLTVPASTQRLPAKRQPEILGEHAVAAGEVLVKFRPRASMAAQRQMEAQADAAVSESVGRLGVRRIQSRSYRTEDLIEAFRYDPNVEYVEPNYLLYADVVPNDPQFGNLWGLRNTGQTIGGVGTAGVDIDAATAWGLTTGSRATVVGIIDTGIDYTHPDLVANVWSAPSSFTVTVGGRTITCLAGTHGYNAVADTCDPFDDNSHGTHTAGTIGAVGNNGVGIAGVNWAASIMALKFLGSNGSGYTSDAIEAIEFAIQAKAHFAASGAANVRVLSNSWGGGGFSQSLLDAINAANTNGMLFVAAAGNSANNNDASPSYPSSYSAPNVVSVAATDNADRLASFSSYGATSVDLGAPGVNILSTIPGNQYAYYSGTSMATPHVSGAADLLLARCARTTAEVKTALLQGVDQIASLSQITATGGRLDVNKVLAACNAVSSVGLVSNLVAPQRPGTTVTWTATATGGVAPLAYKWYVHNGVAWTAVTGWGASRTYAWTPTTVNSAYKVSVWARSAGNTPDVAEAAVSGVFPITAAPVTAVSLTANRTAPQPSGTAITWTATPTGGAAPVGYKWFTYDGTTWTAVTGWGTTNTFVWTPTSANSGYQVRVWARTAGNTVDAAEASAAVAFAITTRITQVSLAANRTAPQAPGTTITWTATAVGGVAPLQYKWYVHNGTAWTAVTGWATGNTYAWTPATANSAYKVSVWVRSAGYTADVAELAASTPFSIGLPVTSVALVANRTAPQIVGTTITWTATPTGGASPVMYKWYLHNGTAWTALTGWVTTSTYAWTPTTGNSAYKISVWARGAGNTIDAAEAAISVPFAIASRVSAVSITPSVTAPRAPNTTVTWTATPTGGLGPVSYKWSIYNGTVWTTVTGWSTTNTFAWTPTSANSGYKVSVWARSAGNVADAAEAAASVPFAIGTRVTSVALAANRTAPQVHGTTVTWTATAVGGDAPLAYKWYVHNGVAWTAVSGWVASRTFAWTPTTANSAYKVSVWVRGAGNSVDALEAAVTVPFPIQ